MENFGTEFSAMIEKHFGLKISKAVTLAIVLIIFSTAVRMTASVISLVFHSILAVRKNGTTETDIKVAIYTGIISFGIYVILVILSHNYIVRSGKKKIDKMREKANKEMEEVRQEVRLLRLEAHQAVIKAGHPEWVKPPEECWEQDESLSIKKDNTENS